MADIEKMLKYMPTVDEEYYKAMLQSQLARRENNVNVAEILEQCVTRNSSKSSPFTSINSPVGVRRKRNCSITSNSSGIYVFFFRLVIATIVTCGYLLIFNLLILVYMNNIFVSCLLLHIRRYK
jgi:hypothetical protein